MNMVNRPCLEKIIKKIFEIPFRFYLNKNRIITYNWIYLYQWINRIYHHTVEGTRESHPSAHDLQSTTRLVMDVFSLLRQEYPPILTSGEMLSHPGGWDKPIPEVIHLWRHRTSTPNNLEKLRLVGVLYIFYTFLDKNEKNNQTPHWGRDLGIPSSCPIFATSTTRQASSWITNLGHSDGIPSSLPQCGIRFY